MAPNVTNQLNVAQSVRVVGLASALCASMVSWEGRTRNGTPSLGLMS